MWYFQYRMAWIGVACFGIVGLSIERRKVAESCYANSVWCNEDTATPFRRQPRYSVVSFKSTQPDMKTVSKSLEKSTI